MASRCLSVASIECFEGNPRLVKNPEYERIKQSIRDSGLMQPLVVTQAPGSKTYVVEAGGNSRLQVLKELLEETGETRFASAECVIRPWVSFEHVLIAHLKENELRGDLSFIEKALAVCKIEARLNQARAEQLRPVLGQRAVAARLCREGLGIAQSLLPCMHYAVDRLLPVLGNTLRGGLGRPGIERLRRLDESAACLWRAWDIDTPDEFDTAFTTLCARHDSAFDIDTFKRDLEYEMTERTDVSLECVRLAVNTCIEGDAPPPKPTPVIDPFHDLDESRRAVEIDATVDSNGFDDATVESRQPDADQPSEIPSERRTAAPSIALEGLRTHAHRSALALAAAFGLDSMIIATPDFGVGFQVADFPDRESDPHRSDDRHSASAHLWWTLMSISEMTLMSSAQIKDRLPRASRLRASLLRSAGNSLRSNVGKCDPSQVAHAFWNALDEDQWATYVDLIETYRTLRSCFSPDAPLCRLA
ncbi:MAG TPA: hypothetical protein PKK10_00760 [Woeseiaceae bacterium]|nr:hypothetical protein [Woeseiaceae bacterium]